MTRTGRGGTGRTDRLPRSRLDPQLTHRGAAPVDEDARAVSECEYVGEALLHEHPRNSLEDRLCDLECRNNLERQRGHDAERAECNHRSCEVGICSVDLD